MQVKFAGLHEQEICSNAEYFHVGNHFDVGEILLAFFNAVDTAAADWNPCDLEIDDEFINAESEPTTDDAGGSSGFIKMFLRLHVRFGICAGELRANPLRNCFHAATFGEGRDAILGNVLFLKHFAEHLDEQEA